MLTRTPANVFSKFTELRGAGGTFFMLDREDMQAKEAAREAVVGKHKIEAL